ncbi:MAG: DUF1178 family protein [Sphingosinicella sp.]|uniref:DUF1178 family protein n=1 Tax=Sphingosinicella sp. TaxID=1917971 RepID=UPI004037F768
MIVFDLRCATGHVFEGWFGSSAEFESQQTRGLVSCPLCGSFEVAKAPMAPRIGAKGNASSDPWPAAMKKMLAEMATMQRQLLEKSDNVGDRFPDEARAIHLGEAEARAIHGRASRADAESLAEDGIPISPLPFPVPEPGEEN